MQNKFELECGKLKDSTEEQSLEILAILDQLSSFDLPINSDRGKNKQIGAFVR